MDSFRVGIYQAYGARVMENKDIIIKGMADVVQSTERIIEEAADGSKDRDPWRC